MNDKFDELVKGLAQAVTRRSALKKFGLGLAGIALACLGLTKAEAQNGVGNCNHCVAPYGCGLQDTACLNRCVTKCLHGGGGL